jgi:hypothetical protein
MEITYIYELSKDGIPFYIGKTKNINSRKAEHKRKYSETIILTVIDSVESLDKKDWKPLETFWIIQYKAWGFNLTNSNNGGGGPSGWMTKEDKKKYNRDYDKDYYYRKKYNQTLSYEFA